MTVRRYCGSAAAAVLVIAMGAPAAAGAADDAPLGLLPRDQAVPPAGGIFGVPGGLRPGSDPFSLLGSPDVQRELKLTDEQISALRRANPLFRSQVEGTAQAGDISAAERERLLWTSRGAIANVLTPAQQTRFRQIVVQQSGPCLIAGDTELQRALDIGAASRGQIADACRALAEQLQAAMERPAAGQAPCTVLRANRARLDRLVREGEAAILARLTAEQRRTLEALEGTEIRIAPPAIAQCPPDAAQASVYGPRRDQ